MKLEDVQAEAFRAAKPKLIFNPDSAIGRTWLALKAEGTFIGVPVGPEKVLEDGTVAQAFTSGAVLHWTGGDEVELV